MRRREFLNAFAGSAVVGMLMEGAAADGEVAPSGRKQDQGARRGSGKRLDAGKRRDSGKTSVAIVREPADPVASAAAAGWAVGELRDALVGRGVPVRLVESIQAAAPGERCVLAAGLEAPGAGSLLEHVGLSLPEGPEALLLAGARVGKKQVLVSAGSDSVGLMYAMLELADRVRAAGDPLAALEISGPLAERPANPVRSMMRLFVSEVEDKPWFYDRAFWEKYLSMLVGQRFNRFHLALGIGYDFLSEVRDSYFHFAYPFLLSVPGYKVRAAGLPDQERDRNLEMLRFISDTAAARGLHFQLGIWTHGYNWAANPGVNYTIEGLNPQNHAPYCRDALKMLLQACPSIQGVTFRIHGESGVQEGSYEFWKTVFEGIVQCGRRVEIDLHAKGIDQAMISTGLATGMPVTVSPKFWAEHQGLPYHQAAIRSLELPPAKKNDRGFFALSGGSRSFLRYGYGDLLTEDRKYGVLYRIWPGTQRLLLWGDPEFAAAYGRAGSFGGGMGIELFEPLSFKGRKGTGVPGGREAYQDVSLNPAGGDWEKYSYTYCLWGRLLYNPEAEAEVWRRQLRAELGEAAGAAEAALSRASRILPLVTTAHDPSAANYGYWPEIYTNMPLEEGHPQPYGDTPSPKRFGTVSPLDPELFSTVEELGAELLEGKESGKYSPLEVAEWMEGLGNEAAKYLREAEGKAADPRLPEFRRLAVDVGIQSGLGRFFAWKLRAGVLYALFQRSGDQRSLAESLKAYGKAREAWLELSEMATGVYVPDITFGRIPNLRGHWRDRLQAIDADIAEVKKAHQTQAGETPGTVEQAIRTALAPTRRLQARLRHTAPANFHRGQPVEIGARLWEKQELIAPVVIRLRYRRVNQAEPYQEQIMRLEGNHYGTVIPADYTNSPYPLQYYFHCQDGQGRASLYPGFEASLTNQPYFVVRQG